MRSVMYKAYLNSDLTLSVPLVRCTINVATEFQIDIPKIRAW